MKAAEAGARIGLSRKPVRWPAFHRGRKGSSETWSSLGIDMFVAVVDGLVGGWQPDYNARRKGRGRWSKIRTPPPSKPTWPGDGPTRGG